MYDFKPIVYLLYVAGAMLLAAVGWGIYETVFS